MSGVDDKTHIVGIRLTHQSRDLGFAIGKFRTVIVIANAQLELLAVAPHAIQSSGLPKQPLRIQRTFIGDGRTAQNQTLSPKRSGAFGDWLNLLHGRNVRLRVVAV